MVKTTKVSAEIWLKIKPTSTEGEKYLIDTFLKEYMGGELSSAVHGDIELTRVCKIKKVSNDYQ